MSSADDLIASLSRQLTPVRPLRPPIARALGWLALVGAVVAVPLLSIADLPTFRARNADPRVALEIAASLLTGIVAVVAAFHLAVPDRSPRWRYAPLAPLALWLAGSGLGCLRNGVGRVNLDCVIFVVAASLPLLALLFWFLRRARPIAPVPVALCAGLGVAGVSAFLLQFFHPFNVTVIDLVLHAVAVAAVVTGAAAFGRRALAWQGL